MLNQGGMSDGELQQGIRTTCTLGGGLVCTTLILPEGMATAHTGQRRIQKPATKPAGCHMSPERTDGSSVAQNSFSTVYSERHRQVGGLSWRAKRVAERDDNTCLPQLRQPSVSSRNHQPRGL